MTRLREWYERTTLPLGRALAKLHITPNQITILSILVGLFPLYFLWQRRILLGLATLLLAVFMDILDGSLARATGKVSEFGQILDHFADRTVEFEIVLGLILGGYVTGWLGTLMYFTMIMPSYIRARGEAVSGISAQGVGLFERKEKISSIVFGLILEKYLPGTFYYVALVISVLSFITSIQRLMYFRRNLREKKTCSQ